MRSSTLAVVTSVFNIAAAATNCKNLTIPVTISARNGKFPESLTPQTNVEVTDFFLNLTRQGTNFTNEVLQGVHSCHLLDTVLC